MTAVPAFVRSIHKYGKSQRKDHRINRMSFKIFTIIGHIFDYGPSRGDRTGNFASHRFLQMHAFEVNLLRNQIYWSR